MAKDDATATTDTGVPKNDAYTGMLVISLLALIIGSVLLFLDKSQYPDQPPPTPSFVFTPPAPRAADKGPDAGKKEGEQAPGVPPNVPPNAPPNVPPNAPQGQKG